MGSDRSWETFAASWALAIWLQGLARGIATTPLRIVVTLSCAAVLLAPSRRGPLALLAASYVAHVWVDPVGVQIISAWLTALASIGILLALLPTAWGAPAEWRTKALEGLRPAGFQFAILWLLCAGFAKLNQDFFDPTQSCARVFYAYQRLAFPYDLLPDQQWATPAVMVTTLLGEIGGPMLMLFRPTRKAGLVLSACVLFLIGTNTVARLYAFVAPVLALLMLGFDWSAVEERVGALLRLARRIAGGLALGSLGVALVLGERGAPVDLRRVGARAIFVVVVAILVAIALRSAKAMPLVVGKARLRPAWLIVPLLFLHESFVYLGLRTDRHIAMASNLMVGPTYSNHWIVRHVPELSFNEPVILLESSDRKLNTRGRKAWVTWMLYDYLGRHPNVSATFQIRGKRRHVARAGDDPRYRPNPIAAWFRVYQTRAKPGSVFCGHRMPKGKRHR